MIDFFEIDVENVEKSRYKEFVVDGIDDKYIKESQKIDKEFNLAIKEKVGKKQKLNTALYYLTMIASFITLILGLLMFQQANPETKYFPWGMLAAVIVMMFVDIGLAVGQNYVKKDITKTMKSDEIQAFGDRNKELENKLLNILGVPEEHYKIDVFARNVRIVNGELQNALRVSYNNYSLYSFVRDGNVYFCDTYELIKLNLSEVTDVKLIKDKITFASWNKKESPRSDFYKSYNVRPTASGFYSVNCFFDIKLVHKGHEYVLRIPGYEVEFVKEVFNYVEGRDDVTPEGEEVANEVKENKEEIKETPRIKEEEKHENQ